MLLTDTFLNRAPREPLGFECETKETADRVLATNVIQVWRGFDLTRRRKGRTSIADFDFYGLF